MLEPKIEELTVAIRELIEVLKSQGAAPAPVAEPEKKPKATKAKVTKKAEPEPQPEPEPVETVSADDLVALCIEIVRADRSKRDTVKDVVASFGATVVADVPTDKLPDLKVALEKLQ